MPIARLLGFCRGRHRAGLLPHGGFQGRPRFCEVSEERPSLKGGIPTAVLKRLQKEIGSKGLRTGDEAWVVVDVDDNEGELGDLLEWCDSHPGYHLAVSNPKFELFLVMHFERANGCTTAAKVDAALKRYMLGYDKRLTPTQFSLAEVKCAVENARAKACCLHERDSRTGHD